MKNELMEVLNIFQEAYIARDNKKIHNFMEALFDKNENIIIVGTGASELCLGYDEAKDIFSGDWEYWGDLRINAAEATIMPLGNTAVIYTTGTVKYTFSSTKETYARYLDGVKEYFDEVSEDSKKSNKVKLTEINWKLCHLLNKWEGIQRDYLWDLRVSFVLVKKETRWIIKQMQFALPVVGYFPDLRIENTGYALESFKAEENKMREYSRNNNLTYKEEIVKFLKSFNNEYLNSNIEVADKYFSATKPLFINTDKTVCKNREEIKKLIEDHRAYYHEMKVDCENCLINANEEVVWIVAHGTFKKVISEDMAFESTTEVIKNIFTSELDDKDKLFNIRRRIADTFKENAKGQEYIWPFKLEAVLIRENKNWVFKYLQFSLPFNYYLEGKTEAATLI